MLKKLLDFFTNISISKKTLFISYKCIPNCFHQKKYKILISNHRKHLVNINVLFKITLKCLKFRNGVGSSVRYYIQNVGYFITESRSVDDRVSRKRAVR